MMRRRDQRFDEMALDPVRRRAAIARLSKVRATQLTLLIVVGVLFLAERILLDSSSESEVTMLLFLVVALGCEATDSTLRLLRVVERLES
jgi:hypothetical protein